MALRKHLRQNRKILDPVINNSLEENNNIFFDLTKFNGEIPGGLKDKIFFVSPEKETRLGYLWDYNKFEKTGIYASYHDASYNFGSELLFCFVAIDPFVVYEAETYSGVGGIFCKRESTVDSGFVIEPLQNYLKVEFPAYWEN
jgi:hypothetical protein